MNMKSKKSNENNSASNDTYSKKSSNSKTKNNKNYHKSSRSKSRNKTKNLRKRTHSSLMSNTRNANHNNHNNHNHNNNNNNNNSNSNNNNYSNHSNHNISENNSNNYHHNHNHKYSPSLARNHISKHNKKRIIKKKRSICADLNNGIGTKDHNHNHTHTHNHNHMHCSNGHGHGMNGISAGPSKEKIIQYKKNLYSDDIDKQLFGVSQLRILLSDEQQPPIELVIRSNCVPRLIEILSSRENINLLFETAWVLTNICSGSHEHTMAVVEANGIECILALLDLTDIAVLEQSIWVLGNIAGDGTNARDICLDKGVLTRLILLAQEQNELATFTTSVPPERRQQQNSNHSHHHSHHHHHRHNHHHHHANNNSNNEQKEHNKNNNNMPLSFQRNFVWTISNLVRGKPQPSWNKVSCVIPIILLYLNCCDIEVLTDTCWALSYLSDGCNEHIQSILDLSLLSSIDISEYLVAFLDKKSMNVLVPALRTCGNIVSGSDHQTQEIIDRGLLTKLLKLLRHPNHSVKKEAIWTVSNITAGNPHQIQLIIDHALIEPLVDILTDYHSDHDLVKECIWAISNATTGGTSQQLRYLSQYASIGLSRVMSHFPNDTKLQLVLLEGLDNLLSFTTDNPIPLSQSPLANMLLSTIQYYDREDNMHKEIKTKHSDTDTTSINQETEQYIKEKEYKNIQLQITDDIGHDIYDISSNDEDDEYMISDDYDIDEINGNQNYVAYIMEQTEAHRILEKWFYDINQDRDVAHLAQQIYKKYFNVPYQF